MRSRSAILLLLASFALAPSARAAVTPHLKAVRCTVTAKCPKDPAMLIRKHRATVAATHVSHRAKLYLRRAGGGLVKASGRLLRPGRLVILVPGAATSGPVRVVMPGRKPSNAVRIKIETVPRRGVATLGDSDPSVWDGNGMWIWYLSRSEGGDPAAIAARARAHDVSTVFVKSGDGGSMWSQFSASAVAALKAEGLRVCAWPFVYGKDPAAEARVAATAVTRGADCLGIDAESAYEGRYRAARIYMDDLRAAVGPDFPIGLASFPYTDYHPGLPFSVFLGPGGADANLPQVYWKEIGTTVDAALAHTYTDNQVYGRTIAPLGQIYNSPPRAQVLRFRRLAAGYGAPGVSWWSWQSASTAGFASVGLPLPAAPLIPAAAPYPVLGASSSGRVGSKGDLVVWAQELLSGGGYTVPISGEYGRATARAVAIAQQDALLPVTGRLDDATWRFILAFDPVVPRWGAPALVASGARSARRARVAGPSAPRSARLPARRNEIPGGPLSPPAGRAAGSTRR